MYSADVTFAMTGDPKKNSRALRQLGLLSDLGLRILVLGLRDSPGCGDLTIQNAKLQYIPRPRGKGPRFFFGAHQQFSSALRNVTSRVYHASDLYTLPAMHHAANREHAYLVFDSRELYTHLPATVGRPWVRAAWGIIQHRYIRRADCVYTVSESIAQHLKKYFQLHDVHVMHNVPEPRTITGADSLREHLNLPSGIKILLHQGNLQKHRGIPMMVESMRWTDGAVLVFMGTGPCRTEAEQLAKCLELDSRIRFMDPVSPDQLLPMTASADLGLTFLEDCCLNHRYALPNKLFEYLAAGVPVIASDLPEIAQIIKRFDVGCVVPAGDARALGHALHHAVHHTELRQTWASNTSRVQDFFNFTLESDHFTTPYRRLMES